MYNRPMDKIIIDCVKKKGKDFKIYIQNPDKDRTEDIIRELELSEENVIPITDTRGFYIPDILREE